MYQKQLLNILIDRLCDIFPLITIKTKRIMWTLECNCLNIEVCEYCVPSVEEITDLDTRITLRVAEFEWYISGYMWRCMPR
jgi:hypothetical protein